MQSIFGFDVFATFSLFYLETDAIDICKAISEILWWEKKNLRQSFRRSKIRNC